MTVSGGEATLQVELLRAMFTTLRADPDLAGLTGSSTATARRRDDGADM